jgi:hypothetical protein
VAIPGAETMTVGVYALIMLRPLPGVCWPVLLISSMCCGGDITASCLSVEIVADCSINEYVYNVMKDIVT